MVGLFILALIQPVGFVNYTDQVYATEKGYISHSPNASNVYIGCDHTEIATSAGRDSIRISTIKTWNTRLWYMASLVDVRKLYMA